MGSRQRKAHRKAELQRSATTAFFHELGLGLLAIPSAVLGLLVVAAFFQVAIEETEGILTGILAYGLALGATVVGFALVGWVATFLVGPMTVGWLGMFSGQIPAEFAPRARNHARAFANLLLMCIALWLGVLLFRHGVREGQANWAVEGIFLAAAGIVLGLAPAIPRFYFARKKGPVEAVDSERAIGLIISIALGIALSLAVSFTMTENRKPSGPKTVRPGRWVQGCVAKESTVCPVEEKHFFLATSAGRHYVDQRKLCGRLFFESEAGIKLREVRWGTLFREGVETYDKKTETKTRAIELNTGQKVVLRVSGAERQALLGSCHYKLRVRPPASKGEAR